ncbi:Dnajc2 [Symbiodinium pilosum]|uniref:Dnajc2 protein n=1 Tax=Symbiodinium pilosum TaxID=2952 RepID=A0A812JN00_SYMPI|nr:Dnajc2 [Symbiodinium pilosum]
MSLFPFGSFHLYQRTATTDPTCKSVHQIVHWKIGSNKRALNKASNKATILNSEPQQAQKRRVEAETERQERQKLEAKKREEKAMETKEETAAWTTDELGLLAKGLQKFPGGMGGRWSLITKLLNDSGYPRAEKEVVDKTKELSEGQSLRSMGSKIAQDFQGSAPKAKAKLSLLRLLLRVAPAETCVLKPLQSRTQTGALNSSRRSRKLSRGIRPA